MRAEIKGGGKLMRRRNLKVALVNTVLAAIILGLYFALSLSHRAQPASVSGFPIYHGNNRKCVAIECAVTWDAAALDEILAVLEERGVRITFAVSGFNDFVGRRVYKTVSAVINLVYNFFLHLSVYISFVHKINK